MHILSPRRIWFLIFALLPTTVFAQPQKIQRRTMGANLGQDSVLRDVTYCTNGGVALKLDVYLAKKTSNAAPCAVYIHGGGWQGGSKSGGSWMAPVTSELLKRGYVVAAVDYRLAPDFQWPAYIHDCKAAIRFLRANAKKFNLDPNRIGAWGTSAGGHLVALLGTADASAKLEGEHYLDQSSRVQAVVDMFGPSDIPLLASEAQHRERGTKIFGGTEAMFKEASPVTYVSKSNAPFLILHGEDDALVHANQAKVLYEKLKTAGVEAKLVMVKNGTHGLNGRDLSPSHDELLKMIVEFFDKHLKK